MKNLNIEVWYNEPWGKRVVSFYRRYKDDTTIASIRTSYSPVSDASLARLGRVLNRRANEHQHSRKYVVAIRAWVCGLGYTYIQYARE